MRDTYPDLYPAVKDDGSFTELPYIGGGAHPGYSLRVFVSTVLLDGKYVSATARAYISNKILENLGDSITEKYSFAKNFLNWMEKERLDMLVWIFTYAKQVR